MWSFMNVYILFRRSPWDQTWLSARGLSDCNATWQPGNDSTDDLFCCGFLPLRATCHSFISASGFKTLRSSWARAKKGGPNRFPGDDKYAATLPSHVVTLKLDIPLGEELLRCILARRAVNWEGAGAEVSMLTKSERKKSGSGETCFILLTVVRCRCRVWHERMNGIG